MSFTGLSTVFPPYITSDALLFLMLSHTLLCFTSDMVRTRAEIQQVLHVRHLTIRLLPWQAHESNKVTSWWASRMLRLEAAMKHPNTSEVQTLLQLYWTPPDSKQVIMRGMALLQLHWPIRVTDKQVRGMIWLLAGISFITKLPHTGQAWRCFKFALVFESTS
jgi:hypothetical protein